MVLDTVTRQERLHLKEGIESGGGGCLCVLGGSVVERVNKHWLANNFSIHHKAISLCNLNINKIIISLVLKY